MNAFLAVLSRDIALGFRSGGGALLAAMFFALVILIFALAIGPDRTLQSKVAAAALWTAVLLSTLISFDRIFQADFEDGSLDTIVETADLLELQFIAKALAHWVTTALPLLALTPLLGLMLGLPQGALFPLLVSLTLGTPALSLIGALAAALTVSLRRAAILVTLLAAPLFTPVLIFGVSAAEAGAAGDPSFASALMLLAVAGLISLIVAPLGGAAAIRANIG